MCGVCVWMYIYIYSGAAYIFAAAERRSPPAVPATRSHAPNVRPPGSATLLQPSITPTAGWSYDPRPPPSMLGVRHACSDHHMLTLCYVCFLHSPGAYARSHHSQPGVLGSRARYGVCSIPLATGYWRVEAVFRDP